MGEIIITTTANQHAAQQNTIHGNAFQQYILHFGRNGPNISLNMI